MDELREFLETSLLPVTLELLKTMTRIAKSQAREHESMQGMLSESQTRVQDMQQAILTLGDGLEVVGSSMTELAKAVNESNALQRRQNEELGKMREVLMTQSSRVNALNVAVNEIIRGTKD